MLKIQKSKHLLTDKRVLRASISKLHLPFYTVYQTKCSGWPNAYSVYNIRTIFIGIFCVPKSFSHILKESSALDCHYYKNFSFAERENGNDIMFMKSSNFRIYAFHVSQKVHQELIGASSPKTKRKFKGFKMDGLELWCELHKTLVILMCGKCSSSDYFLEIESRKETRNRNKRKTLQRMVNASSKLSVNRCDGLWAYSHKNYVSTTTTQWRKLNFRKSHGKKRKRVEMKSEKLYRKFISSAHIAFKFLAEQFFFASFLQNPTLKRALFGCMEK